MNTSKNSLNIFGAAKQLCFPLWDVGAVYLNVIAVMLYPYDDSKRKSYAIRALLEQKIRSQKERGNEYSFAQYASDIQGMEKYFDDVLAYNSMVLGHKQTPSKMSSTKKDIGGCLWGACCAQLTCMMYLSTKLLIFLLEEGIMFLFRTRILRETSRVLLFQTEFGMSSVL